MRVVVAGLFLLAVAGCKKTQETPKAPQSDAAVPAASPSAAAPGGSAMSVSARTTCTTEPKGGFAIPASAKATEIRIASTDTKALVTWWEAVPDPNGGHAIDSAIGHVFEGGIVGPRLTVDANGNLDEPISGAAPVAVGADLAAVTCDYLAPQGWYRCGKGGPGAKSDPLFTFKGIGSGGPDVAGIGVVATATDTAIFVPGDAAGADILVFTASASGKKNAFPFPSRFDDRRPHADGLVAVASGPDEATAVYRFENAILARRAGFDEKWRGKAVTLSTPKALVGAPAVASDGTRVVALFSERGKASDPWHIAMSDLATTTTLPIGDQAQGPGIAARGACFLVSWVEGRGKTTRTRLGRMCNGAIAPDSVTTLSAEGVEGGRAYLTKDFAVWQELPPGRPPELRIAKLGCP